nr:CBS domain-containing protein [uncultured Pseudomonas sp.]
MITATIADCMSKTFARIHPDMPVVQAANLLIRHAMLGGPVVDADGLLLGWISEQECLRVAIQVAYYNQRVATVRDIMRSDVLSVSSDMDPLALAQQMLGDKPKSYPVVDGKGKVLGVVARRNLLQQLDAVIGKLSSAAA